MKNQNVCELEKNSFNIVDIENELINIWKNILGNCSFNIESSFFELGGDSILTIELIEAIKKSFNYQFTITSITANPSIKMMAKVINGTNTADIQTQIVPLQTQGLSSPFFGIHPLFGLIYPYVNLAKEMGTSRPFYAFQSKGYNSDTAPIESIEKLAASYILDMKKVQPIGPYLIGGWSFGAIVAYEMASQLRENGDFVDHLILIDLATDSLEKFFQKVPKHILVKRFLEIANEALISFDPSFKNSNLLFSILKKPKSFLLFFLKILIPMCKIGLTNSNAAKKYILKPYTGHVTLIHTADPEFTNILTPELGWDKIVNGQLDVYKIQGDHLNLHKYPYVVSLASALNSALDNK